MNWENHLRTDTKSDSFCIQYSYLTLLIQPLLPPRNDIALASQTYRRIYLAKHTAKFIIHGLIPTRYEHKIFTYAI